MKEEMFLQVEFAKWLDGQGLLYCASMGGVRVSMVTAINMKKAGYKKGFPDIAILEPTDRCHGLFIELKVNAKTTSEQVLWQSELTKRGYMAVIMPKGLDFNSGIKWLQACVSNYMRNYTDKHC